MVRVGCCKGQQVHAAGLHPLHTEKVHEVRLQGGTRKEGGEGKGFHTSGGRRTSCISTVERTQRCGGVGDLRGQLGACHVILPILVLPIISASQFPRQVFLALRPSPNQWPARAAKQQPPPASASQPQLCCNSTPVVKRGGPHTPLQSRRQRACSSAPVATQAPSARSWPST